MSRRFDESYRETVRLRDGTEVTLRAVRPDDKALLREGFTRLSPESRFRRFLTAKNELSDAELAYLTELDGENHYALGATVVGREGAEIGLGIARFIRSREDPRCAEAAVAVTDDWHQRGIGTLLLLRLVAAARERGVERIQGRALIANTTLRDMLGQLADAVVVQADDGEVAIDADLAAIPTDLAAPWSGRAAPLRKLFSLVARGLVSMRGALRI